MVQKFRKKPVVIEAMHWDGKAETAGAIIDWALEHNVTITYACNDPEVCPHTAHHLVVRTLEGDMAALPNDWVIKGIKGEFYPCKPDIFADTYESVKD